MAKILNKDPVTYQRERDSFTRELQHFHETRGTPFRKVPKINGHEVDLYLLYVLVTAHGGWEKVNSRNEWDALLEQFSVPKACVNSGVALKQVYLRYLDRYEKVHYLGEDVDREEVEDEDSRHKRWSSRALHAVTHNYNHQQHNVTETARSSMGLSVNLYKPSDYDRLALSLVSPLPNEQDFAINVCTLLSNEGKHTLRLDKYPRLIDFLLAHTGVFSHTSTRELFNDVYARVRSRPMGRFWSDVVEDPDFWELTDENFISRSKITEEPLPLPKKPSEVELALNALGLGVNVEEEACERLSVKTESEGKVEDEDVGVDAEKKLEGDVTETDDGKKEEEMEIDEQSPAKEDEGKSAGDECSVTSETKKDSEQCKASDSVEVTNSSVDVPVVGDDVKSEDLKEETVEPKKERESWLKIDESDRELFCLGRTYGTQDFMGQRVLQIATILRNLSFEDENVTVMAKNTTLLRFLLLCAQSKWNALCQLGLDMLGNVAGDILVEDPLTDQMSAMLITTVSKGLSSPDRFVALSCLEILNKICQNDDNEDVMLKCLDQKVYEQVCTFLTLHDIMLLIYTLECMYSLSSLGERACNSIVRVHGAIDTLVSLVTVEAQSYGPKACILMRVVETVSGSQGSTTTTTTTTTTSAMSSAPSTQVVTRPNTTSNTSTTNTTTVQQKPATPQRVLIGGPQPAVATPVNLTPAQLQQHQQSSQLEENEQFFLVWLKASYESCPGGIVRLADLHKQYVAFCLKAGRQAYLATSHLNRCIRNVFGNSVGPRERKVPGGVSEQIFEGIKVRSSTMAKVLTVYQRKLPNSPTPPPPPQPVPSPQPPPAENSVCTTEKQDSSAPSSPILKAQLSAPPKKPREIPKGDLKSQVLAHPHLTQALLGSTQGPHSPLRTTPQISTTSSGTTTTTTTTTTVEGSAATTTTTTSMPSSSSSLIKSLLATKVNTGECMSMPSSLPIKSKQPLLAQGHSMPPETKPPPQVVQRQQQQRLLQQLQQSSPPPQQQQSLTKSQPTHPSTTTVATSTITTTSHVLSPVTSKFSSGQKVTDAFLSGRPRVSRINGARAVQFEMEHGKELLESGEVHTTRIERVENHVSNTTLRGRRDPPQPPPLVSTLGQLPRTRLDDDSDSAASTANSLMSSGAVSTDGDNSLTSFEGFLLNGIPHPLDIDAEVASNDGSRSEDSLKDSGNGGLKLKGMLADLLEKKIAKDPPNGVLGRELRLSEKGLELVENNIGKAGTRKETSTQVQMDEKSTGEEDCVVNNSMDNEKRSDDDRPTVISSTTSTILQTALIKSGLSEEDLIGSPPVAIESYKPVALHPPIKRPAPYSRESPETKRPYISAVAAVNGAGLASQTGSVSVAFPTKNLTAGHQGTIHYTVQGQGDQQIIVKHDGSVAQSGLNSASIAGQVRQVFVSHPQVVQQSQEQQLVVTPRQIIMSQGQLTPQSQVVISQGQITLQQGQTNQVSQGNQVVLPHGHLLQQGQINVQKGQVLMQSQGQVVAQRQVLVAQGQGNQVSQSQLIQPGQVVISQSQSGQVIVSHAQVMPQGQVFVGTQPTGSSGQYIVSQALPGSISQAAVVMSGAGSGSGPTYVIAQPQTALVHGQTQTVLVAQTPQQQGTNTKTIIILQPQATQKVVMTPQGQQVVVQVPRSGQGGVTHSLAPLSGSVPSNSNSTAAAPAAAAGVVIQGASSTGSPTPSLQNVLHTSQSCVQVAQNVHQQSVPQVSVVSASSNSNPASVTVSVPVSASRTPISGARTTVTGTARVPVSGTRTPVTTTNYVNNNSVANSPQQRLRTASPTSVPSPGAKVSINVTMPATPMKVAPSRITAANMKGPPPLTSRSQTPVTGSRPVAAVSRPPTPRTPGSEAEHSPRATPSPVAHTRSQTAEVQHVHFLCEWRGCMRSFKTANEVYMHACRTHCPLGVEELQCLWERCDGMKRKRFSLMTHLYDRHCNTEVLRMMAVRRRQLSQSGRSEIPPPQPPPPHPGYAPNAAFHAIKRHALEFVNPKELMQKAAARAGTPTSSTTRTGTTQPEQDDNEGPVTKSIRLTSALILRNLVIYSTNGRRFLRRYEPHLASVALSNVESSRTIAQILYDMNSQTHQS